MDSKPQREQTREERAAWLAMYPWDIGQIASAEGVWFLAIALKRIAEAAGYECRCERHGLWQHCDALVQVLCFCVEEWRASDCHDHPPGSIPVIDGVTRCTHCGHINGSMDPDQGGPAKHGCNCWEPITVDNFQQVVDELSEAVRASRSQGSA